MTSSSSAQHRAREWFQTYTRDLSREDFQRLPALLALEPPEQPGPEPELVVTEPEIVEAEAAEPEPEPAPQLGLF